MRFKKTKFRKVESENGKTKVTKIKPKKPKMTDEEKQILRKRITKDVVIGLLIIYVWQLVFNISDISDKSKAREAAIEYEHENDMEIIKVDKDVRNYYEHGVWTPKIGLEGVTSVETLVNTSVLSQDENGEPVYVPCKYRLNVKCDGENVGITVASVDDIGSISTDVKIIDGNMFLLLNMENDDDYFKGYMSSKLSENGTSTNVSNLTVAYDFLILLTNMNAEQYDVLHNCRTVYDGREVDDITIILGEAQYAFRCFVDAETHKMTRVISCLLSGNDATDIYYDEYEIDYFNADEVSGATAWNDEELVTLPCGNLGNSVSDEEMALVLDFACDLSSYGDLTLIDTTGYGTTTESEVTESGR